MSFLLYQVLSSFLTHQPGGGRGFGSYAVTFTWLGAGAVFCPLSWNLMEFARNS